MQYNGIGRSGVATAPRGKIAQDPGCHGIKFETADPEDSDETLENALKLIPFNDYSKRSYSQFMFDVLTQCQCWCRCRQFIPGASS
jgi:hypothetical protein